MKPQPAGLTDARSLRPLLFSLGLILFGDIGAHLVKTGAGSIDVTGIKIPTQNGQWIAADLFRPKIATEQNLVPMVVVCPGFERSKEALDSYSIELARRGMAVVAIDPYSQGASSSSRERRSATVEGYGVIPMVEYISGTPNLNYVDKSKIGAVGYSAGGNAVLQAASHFGGRRGRASAKPSAKGAADGDDSGGASSGTRTPSKLAAVFAGGYVLTMTDAVIGPIRSNVGMDYAFHDEGAFRNVNRNADLRKAPEALRLVNSALDKDCTVSVVELGKIYGDPASRTMRVVYNTRNLHPFLPYDRESIGHVIDFFTAVFELKPAIPASSQTWMFKECFTLASLVGGLLFLVPCASLLLRLPVFALLARPVPPALPALTRGGEVWFWATFTVSALVACYLFVPMVHATTTLFPAASAAQQTWWFPERINNAILLWAVANGAAGLIVFWLTWRFRGRKNGVTSEMLGIRTNFSEVLRTIGLAACVLGFFYLLVFASYSIFHVDFRFFFVSAAASFPTDMFLVSLEYLPFFFIFYLANAIRVNSASRFQGQKEWVSMLIMGLGNSAGLLMILAIQYACFALTGTVFWTTEWLYANLLFGVIPMMFILPYFNRYFFRATGSVFLGPLVTCFVFVLMMLTNNVCYIPRG
jgi:dienelactone hydrolase